MSLSEIFARNLRVRMAALDYKTSDLYRLTGIAKTTLMALQKENNKGVQFETIERISTALSCKPDDFLKLDCEWASKTNINNWKDEVVEYG